MSNKNKTFTIGRIDSIKDGTSLEEAIDNNYGIIHVIDRYGDTYEAGSITYLTNGTYNFNDIAFTEKEDLMEYASALFRSNGLYLNN